VHTPASFVPSEKLLEVLERSQRMGFLGPGPLEPQVAHALGFAEAAESALAGLPPGAVLDLGSGGGLPGLALGERWAEAEVVLLDANERRTSLLEEAVDLLGWRERVSVIRQRAEEAGRVRSLRASFDVVVARSFGPPPVTAECAAPFLRPGGILVVSEPPGGPSRITAPQGACGREAAERWPASGLAMVGLEPAGRFRRRFGYQVIRQVASCPERYPRRVGLVAKRPLYPWSGTPPLGRARTGPDS